MNKYRIGTTITVKMNVTNLPNGSEWKMYATSDYGSFECQGLTITQVVNSYGNYHEIIGTLAGSSQKFVGKYDVVLVSASYRICIDNAFELVKHSEEADVNASTVTVAYNANYLTTPGCISGYEEWVKMPENAGKSVADYLTYLRNDSGIEYCQTAIDTLNRNFADNIPKLNSSITSLDKKIDDEISRAKEAESGLAKKPIETADIKDSAVTSPKIADNAVTTSKIKALTVTTSHLVDGAVTSVKIGNRAVITEKINDGAVTSLKLADSAMSQAMADAVQKEADRAYTQEVELSNLLSQEVARAKAAEEANATSIIGNERIADGAVTSGKIALQAITKEKLGIGCVREVHISDEAVTYNKIGVGEVATDRIAPQGVLTGNIRDKAITSPKIIENAIHEEHILDGSVTGGKIAEQAITTSHIANAAVGSEQLKMASVSTTKIAAGAVVNSKISDDAVTTEKIADGSVTASKIADGAVASAAILDNSISTVKIRDYAVTNMKLADESVDSSKLGMASVSTAKIEDGAIVTSKIKDGAVTSMKLADGIIVQEKGDNEKAVISQRAVTDMINTLQASVDDVNLDISSISTLIENESKVRMETDEMLETMITEEVSQRESQVTSLNEKVAGEISRSTTADADHGARLFALEKAQWPLELTLSASRKLFEYTGSEQTVNLYYEVRHKGELKKPESMTLLSNGIPVEIEVKEKDIVPIAISQFGSNSFSLTANAHLHEGSEDESDIISSTVNDYVEIVLPIYAGFGITSSDVVVEENKKVRNTASGTYTKTSEENGVHFFILVPDMQPFSQLKSFVMGGAQFVMESNYITAGEFNDNYIEYKSGAVFNEGATVNIIAS